MHPSFVRRMVISTAALAAGWAAMPAAPALAQGDLLVAPTRIVMDGRRGTEVILSNIGSEEAVYRINLELRRMGEDGQLYDVTEEEANQLEEAALEMVRFAPRRVTLPPGQPQAVRLASRPPAELPDGEYRAHMSFRAIPRPQAAEDLQQSGGVAVQLIPIYAVTIPIIIRKGNITAQATLSNPGLLENPDGSRTFQVVMERSGKASTFGQLRVFRAGTNDVLLTVPGVAIYPEIDRRLVSAPLSPEEAAALGGQRVRIEYTEMPAQGGTLIASIETTLG